MRYDRDQILAYWDSAAVESMYDKHLLGSEIRLIRSHLTPGAKILDAGCGEGEGTIEYSMVEGVSIVAADFSDTRLMKARARLDGRPNVTLMKVDFLAPPSFPQAFDYVVSQRFLINLTEWELQKAALLTLTAALRAGGRLLMLEGSTSGVEELNALRTALGLAPIPVKWHNRFFDDAELTRFMAQQGFEHEATEGLGTYLMLTRAIRPLLEAGDLDWDCRFNATAASAEVDRLLGLGPRFSRLKLWVFRRP
jgi:ubiquinone/menaquinone biosynthesis C-methylase UbiE